MKSVLINSLIGIFFLLQTELAIAMNLLGFKVCLATEMKAVITYEGKPAEGATITRVVNFNNKDYTTTAQSDSQGNFILPALYERTLWKNTPFETLMLQKVTIAYRGQSHLGVETLKRNFDNDGELNIQDRIDKGLTEFVPYQFTCELTDEEHGRSIKTATSTIHGKCLIVGEKKPARTSKGSN